MKKTLTVVMAMGLALAFVGCGSKEATTDAQTATEAVILILRQKTPTGFSRALMS